MSRKVFRFCFVLFLLFFSWAHFTYASFEITEIMYDLDGTDTNREWVEVKNVGSNPDDLSKWYLFSDNIKHSLTPQGVSSVPAGGYAVIAQNAPKFKADWPNYSGILFDSSWTGFSNDGETIALKDPDQNVVSSVTFTSSMGGNGDGNSLQKVNSTWVGALPTPGVENQSGGSGNGGTPGSDSSTIFQKPPTKKELEEPKITTNIITKSTVFAGLPFLIDENTFGLSKEPLPMGRFVWNFGDGITKVESEHHPFDYTYQYPGDYIITLSYFRTYNNTTLEATDRFNIKVIPSSVSISSVGAPGDPFVELENKSSFEVDLSNWTLKGQFNSFIIPAGTIILPNNKLKFSPRATNFNNEDLRYIDIQNSKGEVVFSYPQHKTHHSESSYNSTVLIGDSKNQNVIDLNDLGASSAQANLNISNKTLSIIGLFLLFAIGVISTILLFRKNNQTESLEKNISASDINIIE